MFRKDITNKKKFFFKFKIMDKTGGPVLSNNNITTTITTTPQQQQHLEYLMFKIIHNNFRCPFLLVVEEVQELLSTGWSILTEGPA